VVDHTIRAAAGLRGSHHTVTEREVLFVAGSGEPAVKAMVLALLSEAGVNVDYAYSGQSEGPRHSAALIVAVDDPIRAAAATGI
jgi:hypothetical protein